MYKDTNALLDRSNPWTLVAGPYPRFESPTCDRFQLDNYWAVQIFSFFSPQISGALSWDIPEPTAETDAWYKNILRVTRSMANVKAPAAIGAILVDADAFFSNEHRIAWNTVLPPFLLTARRLRTLNQKSLAIGNIGTVSAPKAASPNIEPYKAQLPFLQTIELETPHGALLEEVRQTSPWTSWKKLETVLGASHTQLQRIASGTLPSATVASNIDDLHRFVQRLNKISRRHPTATLRVLTTPRARDGKSANDFLARQDYRNAFRAVMEAASPNPTIVAAEPRPLRWFDQPSRDLYEDGAEPEE